MNAMHPTRPLAAAVVRGGLALAAGLAFLLGAAAPPAAASSALAPVPLGTHQFGHLRAPDTVVAHADPDEVGFSRPPPGADGVAFGPWSFDVANDGSIWLLDEVNHRLLVWQPGQVDHPARTVPLPLDPLERVGDFAVAPDHTIYATYVPPPGPGSKTLRLCRLDARGRVLWTAATIDEIFNAQLRIGPDNALYVVGGQGGGLGWTPLTTPAGRALPLADQRRRTSPAQPLPGGLRLTPTHPATGGEWRFTLANQAGHTLRGWRVTSQTELGALGATPALAGGDPVVVLEVSKQTSARFLYEYEVLRLARGGTSLRFAVTPAVRAVWGDAPVTGVRVGPDGRLYQLRTSPTAGVSVARYSLTPVRKDSPTTTATAPPPTTGPRVDSGGITAPTAAGPVTPAVDPAADRSALGRWLPWLAGVAASALAGLALWLLYRRRHPAGLGPNGM
jgi:hypothetical protein